MARTPLAALLEEAAAIAAESLKRDLPTDRITGERISRRELLRRTAIVGVAGAAALTVDRSTGVRAATAPRIAVIGAGLAGLTCAYRLQQAGYAATVYEASDRVGGRCWTIRDVLTRARSRSTAGS